MISFRHTTVGRTPVDDLSARRRDLFLTTQDTTEDIGIHESGGVQTRNPNKRATPDPTP